MIVFSGIFIFFFSFIQYTLKSISPNFMIRCHLHLYTIFFLTVFIILYLILFLRTSKNEHAWLKKSKPDKSGINKSAMSIMEMRFVKMWIDKFIIWPRRRCLIFECIDHNTKRKKQTKNDHKCITFVIFGFTFWNILSKIIQDK